MSTTRHQVHCHDRRIGLLQRKDSHRSRDWARCLDHGSGIELLEAEFERHVYERHIHDTYAVGVTLRGVQRFSCRGATHNSTPGDVMAIAPGDAHDGRAGTPNGYRYLMFYVPVAIIRDILQDALERPATEFYADAPLVRDLALSQQLANAWTAMVCRQPTLVGDELFHRSIVALAARHSGLPRLPPVFQNASALKRVREYLHERTDRGVTVRELATIASMSRFQLTRQFQRAFGLPLHAYHLHARLEEAKRRLRQGMPIIRVATDLGFVDQSHFHRRFKGAFGVTPNEWRRSFA